MAKTLFGFEKTPQPSARAVLNFMFWLIAMPFRERSREASAFLNPNIWYEPSDLSAAFKAFIVPFHNVAFPRWSYDPASSIYFTISLGLCFSTWLWLTFRPSSRSRLKLLNFTVDALPTNEIIYHEALPMLFFSRRWKWARHKRKPTSLPLKRR